MRVCDAEICTGCKACSLRCPKHCIEMKIDADGFRYAEIDEKSCVHCNVCKTTCPAIHKQVGHASVAAFAFQATENERAVQKESASGGAFYVLAQTVLSQGGVVYGCAWGENFQVQHICVKELNELYRLQKSKYVQSDTMETYIDAKHRLQNGQTVLYSGTPCQIAGLKSFLQKDYSNLVTADIVCHGVPSQKLFDDYLSYRIAKGKKLLTKFEFRTTNPLRPKCDGCEWWTKKGKEYVKPLIWQNDSYYWAFMHGVTYRPSCYKCQYANRIRVSDITLGDFWGTERISDQYDDSYGVSLVLINTAKGKEWLEIANMADCLAVNIEDACSTNGQLNHPSDCSPKRDDFFKTWKEQGYAAVDRAFRKAHWKDGWKAIVVYYFPQKLKKMLKNAVTDDYIVWRENA